MQIKIFIFRGMQIKILSNYIEVFRCYDFWGLHEQETRHFFRRKFSSTKIPSKFPETLKLINSLDGASSLMYSNNLHDSLSTQ